MAKFEAISGRLGKTTLTSGLYTVIRDPGYSLACVECGLRTNWRFQGDLIYVCSEKCLAKWADSESAITPATDDPVNAPFHYTSGGVEVIDALEAWGLDRDFCLGNVVKYVARAGKKDPAKLTEDLKKARWYLDRRIKQLETNG